MTESISESRFNMWRAVFAMAHVDDFLALEEQGMLYGIIESQGFSDQQVSVLREDVATAQSPDEMFAMIKDSHDRVEFFSAARALVWCDGNLSDQETEIIEHLKDKYNVEEASNDLAESSSATLIEKLHETLDISGFSGLLNTISGERNND